jgi:AraC-like DNA-binding protein
MFSEHTSAEMILFFIFYGVTGAMALFAAAYLLLRRGNAFAPEVTPPLRLRRWAASFFAVSALGHVWWLLLYIFSDDSHSGVVFSHSVGYVVVVVLDCVTLLTTMVGTLLAMLQDRRRPVWPVFVAMIPFVVLGGMLMVSPSERLLQIAVAYVVLLYVLFTVYVAFAVRQYGRWLRDNYADLERKEVWITHVVSLVFMLLFIFYAIVDTNIILIFLLHVVQLVFFGLLLWRVETLPQLDSISAEEALGSAASLCEEPDVLTQAQQAPATSANINLDQVEQLLAEYCVKTQLYLQHDLTLQQLAQAVGLNRYYISQYFSTQGLNYNTYINGLRITHFVSLYREAVDTHQSITAQQLAHQSGFHSYRTFSEAFRRVMNQSVSTWMKD